MSYAEGRHKVAVIYFGDFDPSGLDMVRDIEDRLIFMMAHGENRLADEAIDWYYGDNSGVGMHDILELSSCKNLKATRGNVSAKQETIYRNGITELYIRKEELLTIQHASLTREQIDEYNPPPNPAKITDSRAAKYIAKHGSESWEVDALSPKVMAQLAEVFIISNMEDDKYRVVMHIEQKDKAQLKKIIDSIDI